MTRIFLIGATGYIGGDVLHAIANSLNEQDVTISCLVRNDEKATLIKSAFPNRVRIVKGDFDDIQVIEAESRESDVVFNLASTKHLPCAKAIAAGLGHQGRSKPGYWIQMSGASLFVADEIKTGQYGEPSDLVYDDVADEGKILGVIRSNPARSVDNLVISQDPSATRTALIVGPLIYGVGRGIFNTRSIQAPEIARVSLKTGKGFQLNKGQNRWSNVHIQDLSEIMLKLLHAAIRDQETGWNQNGVYLPENGDMSFGKLCQSIVDEAHKQGFVKSDQIEDFIDADEANRRMAGGAILWGTNALLKSSKAQQLLGWQPKGPSLAETLPDLVSSEARQAKPV